MAGRPQAGRRGDQGPGRGAGLLRRLRPAGLTAVLLLFAGALVGQTYPSLERGFHPEKVYDFGGIDNINLMNGNLILKVPIGSPYPVGGGLSYGLSLVYNSKAWDFQETFFQGLPYSQAVPDRLSNAGMGWSLSLGRLLDPNRPVNGYQAVRWTYVGPDGAEHAFYQGLQTVGPPGVDPCVTACYSRDGSYLRMTTVSSSQRIVEYPDGTRHVFQLFTLPDTSQEWRITAIKDRFEDGLTDVAVSYSADANTWTITDKHGRTQRVFFGADPSGRYPRLLTRIELSAFGGGSPAVYTFSYLPPQTVSVPCSSTLPSWTSVSVSLLSSVFLPDGTSYGAQYYTPTDGGDCRARGVISDLYLPTKGKLHYYYRLQTLPVKGCSYRSWHSYTAGIATRQLLDAAGHDAGTWTYSSVLSPSPWPTTAYVCDDGRTPFRPPSEEEQVTVVTPLLDKSVHYFSVFPGTEFPSTSSFDQRDYGLPFSKLPAADSTGTRFLSTQVFNCDAAGANCSLARSTYVTYERDADSRCDVTTGPGPDCLNTNRRLSSQRTVYNDDGNRFADLNYSDFDGFGHYRTESTDGNFNSGNQRTTTTSYNPGNVLPSTSGSWVLNTYTDLTVTEGTASSRLQFCFDPDTGYLRRKRTYSTGTNPAGNDLLIVNTPDTAGNTIRQEWYGGDAASQSLSLSTNLCALALPAANAYRLDNTYQYGALQSSQWKDAAGSATGPLGFKAVDQDVDMSTGQVATSRDTAGLATAYSYDAMGRLLTVKPQTSGVAWDQYTYVNAGSGTRARQEVRKCSPVSLTACTALEQSQTEYDDFGRVAKERSLMADGTWSKRVTTYDLAGNVATVSSRQADTTADTALARTTYSGYDSFGRPGTITPPDGAAHNVTLGYAGVRVRTRTVTVGTGTLDAGGNVPETAAATTQIFDRQGRLWRVTEPSGPAGAGVNTDYTYDVGNRIGVVKTSAAEGTQLRFFTYDNRGFLSSETHPEKGGLQRKSSGYDPLGNAGRMQDTAGGPNDLSFSYDRAGRLLQISETGVRPVKVFTYGAANAAGNLRSGKLETAKRYNYVLLGATPYTAEVTQTYVYGGLAGRISRRDTALVTNGTPGESFTQSFAWDAPGNLSSLGSSRCTYAPCTGAPASERTISYSYANGYLTAVPGYASSITYAANGMVSQILHANGVTDTQAVDTASWLPRPLSISTSGGVANWSTGPYRYDGAGDVTKMGTDWFQYDGVSRLVRGVVHDGLTGGGNQKEQDYAYDTYGNIKQITTIAGTTQTRLTPTDWSTNRLTGTAVYDAAGNLKAWNGAAYEYDKLNKMWHLVNGAEEWIYFYTADEERFWSFKVGGNFSRWTLRDLGGRVLREYNTSAGVWSVAADYVYRENRLLAAETPGGQRHFHLDHLGTPRLITNALAQQVAYHVYYPFGEEATAFNQDAERMKFTGHERDLASLAGPGDDLDYMHQRFFNPQVARFQSFDPVGGNPELPQTWNRYAYTLGNPLKYVDPTGRVEADAFRGDFGTTITVKTNADSDLLIRLYHFFSGAANAYASDALLGRGRYEMNNADYQSGQALGDAAAVVGGVVEAFYGAGGEVLGFGLDATGVGAVVGVPVNIVSAGVIAHGLTTSGVALSRGLHSRSSGVDNEGRNTAQDRKLSEGDIKRLQKAGLDPEELKGGVRTGQKDLYKDGAGNLYVKPKGGSGPGDPLFININDLH